MLSFDEFLQIPPCTTGVHSAVDDTPKPEKKEGIPDYDKIPVKAGTSGTNAENRTLNAEPPIARFPIAQTPTRATPSPKPPEETDEDDSSLEIPDSQQCRRRGCKEKYRKGSDRSNEKCVHHPGVPIFHEGSKGYTCCKRRVLEFDEFLRIEGCTTKDRHLFIGSGKKHPERDGLGQIKRDNPDQKVVPHIRYDFYQTPTQIIASFYLKKIDRKISKVEFASSTEVGLDLKTEDGKMYCEQVELFGSISPQKSSFRITPQKLELTLSKADGAGWLVLKADDMPTGEIIQSGRARFA